MPTIESFALHGFPFKPDRTPELRENQETIRGKISMTPIHFLFGLIKPGIAPA